MHSVEGLPVRAEVLMAADPPGIAEAAAERLTAWLKDALDVRPSANLALTGGSSAGFLATELRQRRWHAAVPWERVHLWWGDERFVPASHAESNFGAAFRDLLNESGLPVPTSNIHPVPVDTALADGQNEAWTADAYASEIGTCLPRHESGLPAFDVILLGVGTDGHILSVFPGRPAVTADAPIVMAVPAPTSVEPKLPRITLNPRLLDAAAHVMPMVGGASKALVVKRILSGPHNPGELPAQLATGQNATWLLDRAAAAEIEELLPA